MHSILHTLLSPEVKVLYFNFYRVARVLQPPYNSCHQTREGETIFSVGVLKKRQGV